ncbi:MAG: hypothetical protein LBU34_14875 [Planctomycetaceae bacterium]|jgi:hypothetical protein|nr:hypothetical protein [Planctomycetaceae bacterium]
MCLTGGGAKRNLRIGNPTKGWQMFADFAVKNSQGRQSLDESPSPKVFYP